MNLILFFSSWESSQHVQTNMVLIKFHLEWFSRAFWLAPFWADWSLSLLYTCQLPISLHSNLGIPFTSCAEYSTSWIPLLPLATFTPLFWWSTSSSSFLRKQARKMQQMPSGSCPYSLDTFHMHAFSLPAQKSLPEGFFWTLKVC